jgi:hypothetical protein
VAKSKTLFGFGSQSQADYRAEAGKGYDPEFDIKPARLHLAYRCCNGYAKMSEAQKSCALRSCALYLLDANYASDCLSAYDEAVKWLVKIGWPFERLSDLTFEKLARDFLAEMETRYGKAPAPALLLDNGRQDTVENL